MNETRDMANTQNSTKKDKGKYPIHLGVMIDAEISHLLDQARSAARRADPATTRKVGRYKRSAFARALLIEALKNFVGGDRNIERNGDNR